MVRTAAAAVASAAAAAATVEQEAGRSHQGEPVVAVMEVEVVSNRAAEPEG